MKLVKNFFIFLLTIFQIFLLIFDMSIWKLLDNMFLQNEGKDNKLFFTISMYPLLNFWF
jgi:hypothetical protein